MRSAGDDLTARQRECLEFIQWYLAKHGYGPTLREIGRKMGIRSTNGPRDHLVALAKKGRVRLNARIPRGVVPLTGTAAPVDAFRDALHRCRARCGSCGQLLSAGQVRPCAACASVCALLASEEPQ